MASPWCSFSFISESLAWDVSQLSKSSVKSWLAATRLAALSSKNSKNLSSLGMIENLIVYYLSSMGPSFRQKKRQGLERRLIVRQAILALAACDVNPNL